MNAWFNFLFEKIWMYPDVFILSRNYSSYIDISIYKKNGCYIPRWLICNLTRPPQLTTQHIAPYPVSATKKRKNGRWSVQLLLVPIITNKNKYYKETIIKSFTSLLFIHFEHVKSIFVNKQTIVYILISCVPTVHFM